MPGPVIGPDGLETGDYSLIKLQARPGVQCAAIAVRVHGAQLIDAASAATWALIKGIGAEGHGLRGRAIRITATDPPASDEEYLAASIYNKILDSNYGMPQVVANDIGEGTEIQAAQHGRQLLQHNIDLTSRRVYEFTANIPDTLPEKGDTVAVYDGFAGSGDTLALIPWWLGVVLSRWYEDGGGTAPEKLTLDLVDYRSAGL